MGLLAVAILAVVGCVSPLQAPSAFSSERFLCAPGDQAQFDALLTDCREATVPPCAGYVSVRGVIEGEPVTVDAPVIESNIISSTVPGGPPTVDVLWVALAPYFRISLHMSFLVDLSTGVLLGPFDPTPNILNLEVRGGNYLSNVSSTMRDVHVATMVEVSLGFSGALSRGGTIEGCFHVFPRRL